MASPPTCAVCQRPIQDMPVLEQGRYYHVECWAAKQEKRPPPKPSK